MIERTADLSSARNAVTRELAQGNNVMFMDSNHQNPDHLALLSDPQSLEAFQQGAQRSGRDLSILLEASPSRVERYRSFQQQGMSENQIREALVSEGHISSSAYNVGREDQEVAQTASLIYHSGRLGIPLMDHDQTIGTEDTRERVSPDAITASQGDQQIARDAAREANGRLIIGVYGAEHFTSHNDLDEQLTRQTGRPTRTFMMEDNERFTNSIRRPADNLRAIHRDQNGTLDTPDYMYRSGETRRMREDVLTNQNCVDPGNWMTPECSNQVRQSGQNLRRAGMDANGTQNVSYAELGELTPMATPGMERSREIGMTA